MTKPPRMLECLVWILVPPACREHVLGDLHERCNGAGAYVVDAARTVPLVIWSRILRTTDPQLLLMEAFALYLSFVGTAWWRREMAFLYDQSGLALLAIPCVAALLALVLMDAYADPRRKSMLRPVLQSAAAIALAFFAGRELVLPWDITLYGASGSLILVSALRVFFAAPEIRPRGGA